MRRIRRATRGPAITVASVAVLATAVGTALAESGPATTSVSVKKLSKQTRRALGRANRAVRIARQTSKQAGPTGDTGAQGPRGDTGTQGPQGPPGVSGLVIVEASTEENAEDEKEKDASCPPGKRVFGGGALVDGAYTSVAIDLTAPDGDSAWSAAAHEHTATAEGWQLRVYAICANAT